MINQLFPREDRKEEKSIEQLRRKIIKEFLNSTLRWRPCRRSAGQSRSEDRSRVVPASPAPPGTACRGIPAGDRRTPAWAARRWCARAAIAGRLSLFAAPPERYLQRPLITILWKIKLFVDKLNYFASNRKTPGPHARSKLVTLHEDVILRQEKSGYLRELSHWGAVSVGDDGAKLVQGVVQIVHPPALPRINI